MESWMLWVGRDLKVHLVGRDTYHQTRAVPSPIQHSRNETAPVHQGKLLQRNGGKKEKQNRREELPPEMLSPLQDWVPTQEQ